jgi:hypothetical protein
MATAQQELARPRAWHSRRVTDLLVGLVLISCSVGMLCVGALAAIAGSQETYVELGGHGTYRTDRYGLTTMSTNWRDQFLGWAASVRLRVASVDHKRIFVGVAPADAVGRYLSGTGYTAVADHARTNHDGPAPATPPREAVEWTADAQGMGTQTLRWHATDRPQIVFAMNADRSRPVRVRIISSAVTLERMPWWVPAGALIIGVLLAPPGLVTLRRAIRPRSAERSSVG